MPIRHDRPARRRGDAQAADAGSRREARPLRVFCAAVFAAVLVLVAGGESAAQPPDKKKQPPPEATVKVVDVKTTVNSGGIISAKILVDVEGKANTKYSVTIYAIDGKATTGTNKKAIIVGNQIATTANGKPAQPVTLETSFNLPNRSDNVTFEAALTKHPPEDFPTVIHKDHKTVPVSQR